MGWMNAILSLLGLKSKGNRGPSTDQITVEREPEAEAERAVKEPGGAGSDEGDDGPVGTGVSGSESNDVAENIEDTMPEEPGSETVETLPGDDDDSDSDEAETSEVDPVDATETDVAEADDTADPDTGVSDDETAATDDRELTTEDASAGSVEEGEPLTDIKGIGPAYADRLTDAGVDDVATLVTADPDALSEDIDVSPKRIQRWIDRAQED